MEKHAEMNEGPRINKTKTRRLGGVVFLRSNKIVDQVWIIDPRACERDVRKSRPQVPQKPRK